MGRVLLSGLRLHYEHLLLFESSMVNQVNLSWGRSFYVIILAAIMCGCSNSTEQATTWKTYANRRYGFEFPYPSNWNTLLSPENQDGIAFVSPGGDVEIRGWAGNQLRSLEKSVDQRGNFKTKQGRSGQLAVDVGLEVSSMNLTLTQGEVHYYWRGQCRNEKFGDYYRFFYYIATEYRIK
jgi:hypothetical protein